MNPESEIEPQVQNGHSKCTNRAVGYPMSILPELGVVDVSELAMVTGEVASGVSCLSAAVTKGWGSAGDNGDWGSVVVSVDWGSAAVKV